MANYRAGRLEQEILKVTSDILMKTIRDPRIEGVTLTEVEATGDLQEATIYYSTLDETEEERKEVQEGLDKATPLFRHELGQHLTTYHTPEIKFVRDESIEYGNKIDQLLDQLKDKEE